MKEFVEKLIGRLEEEIEYDTFDNYKEEPLINMSFEKLEDIVDQLAEEHKTEREKVVKKLLDGEWVNTKDVEMYLGIDFKLGLKLFDFSRTADWWSIVGKTAEERAREGQKITTKFRLKNYNNGWIPYATGEELPNNGQKVWLSFTTEYTSFVKSAFWIYDHFEWKNGKKVKDVPSAWKPYKTPAPYQKGE